MSEQRETGEKAGAATVAVVDDDPSIVKVVSLILRASGFEVLQASGGREALELVASAHPDAVLLDIMMPDIDGFEVLRSLKENPDTMEIPVILLTARTGSEYVEKGRELGAEDYIIKPFSPAALLAKIREVSNSLENPG